MESLKEKKKKHFTHTFAIMQLNVILNHVRCHVRSSLPGKAHVLSKPMARSQQADVRQENKICAALIHLH